MEKEEMTMRQRSKYMSYYLIVRTNIVKTITHESKRKIKNPITLLVLICVNIITIYSNIYIVANVNHNTTSEICSPVCNNKTTQ